MKTLALCWAVVGFAAAVANGESLVRGRDRSDAPIYTSVSAEPIESGAGPMPRLAPYWNMALATSLYSVSAAGGGVSVDDFYVGWVNDYSTWQLREFKFVGGVAQANTVLFFTFLTPNFAPLESFGVRLPNGGNYIWTVDIPPPWAQRYERRGLLMMWADTGLFGPPATGTWFMDTETPRRGTTGPTLPGFTNGSGVPLNHKFAFIPEPTSITLLAAGLLVVITQRRRE